MNVIIVFPKSETAEKIRSILLRSGYEVEGICTTAAGAINLAKNLSDGIMISFYRLRDGMAIDIYEETKPGFQMLLIGPVDYIEGIPGIDIFTLAIPLHVTDLLSTMSMVSRTFAKWKKHNRKPPKKRSEEDRKLIERAKALLIDRNHFTEEQAHKFLQKASMDQGMAMIETAQMVLSALDE